MKINENKIKYEIQYVLLPEGNKFDLEEWLADLLISSQNNQITKEGIKEKE